MELPAQTIALHLLTLRIISSLALLYVLRKQWKFIRENNPKSEQRVRLVLFFLTSVMLIGNFFPITIDLVSILRDEVVILRLNELIVLYAYSNAIGAAMGSIGWATLYVLADREKVHLKEENKDLHQEVQQLHDTATDVKEKQDIKDIAQVAKDEKAAAKNRKKT